MQIDVVVQQLGIAAFKWSLAAVVIALLSAFPYMLIIAIYNIWFHPLSSYPGPKRVVASRFWFSLYVCMGKLPFKIRALHEEFGDVVRIAPNELSFISSEAWKDTYGHRSGKPEMPKDPITYQISGLGNGSIIVANQERHGYLRRLLSHGFSDKALRDQEREIQMYVDMLLEKIHEQCQNGKEALNLVDWYNYCTFDIISDLGFQEPFGCLESSSYHPWVAMIFDGMKSGSYFRAAAHFPLIANLLKRLIPQRLIERRKLHLQLTLEKARRRKELKTDRVDFVTRMVEPDAGVSETEYASTASVLIVTGSETTATLLSACTFYLLKNPPVMRKLVDEIRSAFASESDINLVSVNEQKYLLACPDESLRVFPPVAGNLPRVVPEGGDTIDGRFVPEKTVVSVSQWATYHSSKNFYLPDEFIPERWLGESRFDRDNRAAHQPFHVGPRNCIGRNLAYLEMKLIMSRILWNFDLELEKGCEDWDEQDVYLLWQKSPLWVKLTLVVR